MASTVFTVTTPDVKSADWMTSVAADLVRIMNDQGDPTATRLTLANVTRASS